MNKTSIVNKFLEYELSTVHPKIIEWQGYKITEKNLKTKIENFVAKASKDENKTFQLLELENLNILLIRLDETKNSVDVYFSNFSLIENQEYLIKQIKHSFPKLIEQMGIARFGHRPKVADIFCGSGQIPFEAVISGMPIHPRMCSRPVRLSHPSTFCTSATIKGILFCTTRQAEFWLLRGYTFNAKLSSLKPLAATARKWSCSTSIKVALSKDTILATCSRMASNAC